MIRHTSTPEAPWYVIPADNKWFARLMAGAALIGTMEKLDLQFPKVEGAALREMMKVRKALLAETSGGRRRT
jgi:Polyphosphate kinase 2 (PPK2)